MLWIHYVVGVWHFAECREDRLLTVMSNRMSNANKLPDIRYSAVVREVEK